MILDGRSTEICRRNSPLKDGDRSREGLSNAGGVDRIGGGGLGLVWRKNEKVVEEMN